VVEVGETDTEPLEAVTVPGAGEMLSVVAPLELHNREAD